MQRDPQRKRKLIVLTPALALVLSVLAGALFVGQSSATVSTKSKLSPIVLGYVGTLSGPASAPNYGNNQFFDAYINYVNHHGGIMGHKINLITLDDAGNPGQSLLDYETLWSQDHAVAIYDATLGDTPLQYAHTNNVPVLGCSAAQCFASFYQTFFPYGLLRPAYGDQVAYWLVKILHKHIKVVDILYSPQASAYNSFIEHYWKKLGATTIYFDVDQGASADCTAYVLKWKAEGVQFMDPEAGTEFVPCVEAESRLGWKPTIAQGGGASSRPSLAQLVGAPLVGSIAGVASTAANGKPIYKHPTIVDRTYVGNIRTYYPNLATPLYLNGGSTPAAYAAALTTVYMLTGTLQTYHKVTSTLLLRYMRSVTYYNNEIVAPYTSFKPSCKSGADGTTWGFWRWDTSSSPPVLTNQPQISGDQWVTSQWLGLGKCILTRLSNEYYPNG